MLHACCVRQNHQILSFEIAEGRVLRNIPGRRVITNSVIRSFSTRELHSKCFGGLADHEVLVTCR